MGKIRLEMTKGEKAKLSMEHPLVIKVTNSFRYPQ